MKVVINTCSGGFGLSEEALDRLGKAGAACLERDEFGNVYYDREAIAVRTDPVLVAVVEAIGQDAPGPYSRLKVVEIPDDVKFNIESYDGAERVAELHRTWA